MIAKSEVVVMNIKCMQFRSIALLCDGSQEISCLDIGMESLHLKNHLDNAVQY